MSELGVDFEHWCFACGRANPHGLHLDFEKCQLLFEGDKKRCRIPARAVISCEVQLMNPNAADDPRAKDRHVTK